MRLVRGVRVALALAGLCAYVSAHGAAAPEESTYPTKPVRLIVPFAPGGTNDILGRMLANHLGARLGRTFIVDNRQGADGAIGTEYVMKANPDGYTLIVLSAAYAMNPAVRKLPYDPQTAVEFIIGLGSGPTVLSVGRRCKLIRRRRCSPSPRASRGRSSSAPRADSNTSPPRCCKRCQVSSSTSCCTRARPRPWSTSSAVRRTRASRPSCRPSRISRAASSNRSRWGH